jgi:A/G-specific adenine glycosylase
MPWKGEKDPYKIWISEIILQQTRVQQGLEYYNRFIRAFPDVKSLASAPEEKVYKLWEGLGYYSRCKNLIHSARYIHSELKGKFPRKYEDILALKGIGSYTAAAIASFAYNEPYAVVDGNVSRVLSRFYGEEIPVNTTLGKKFYAETAQRLLDKNNAALYNQAIMDFGAIICKPALPLCSQCPLREKCIAFKKNKVSLLPVNNKNIPQKTRFFNYLIAEYKGKIYIRKRIQKDIWQNLYEFILIETTSPLNENTLLKEKKLLSLWKGSTFKIKKMSQLRSQKLTHQLIKGRFFYIEATRPLQSRENYRLVNKQELGNLPFPKFIASYLTDKNVPLNLI